MSMPANAASVTGYSVGGGACVNAAAGEYVCALEKTQCADGWNFISAMELEDKYANNPILQCLDDANIIPIGKCTQEKDKEICTGHMSNCEGCFETSDICFQPNVDSCGLQPKDQADGSINFASFGLCVNPAYTDRKHCLWSRDECPEGDVWVTPNTWVKDSALVDDFCTCDKVQVGACYKDANFVCAVSADSCGDAQQYIGAKDLTEQYPNIDCRLCKEFSIPKDATLNYVGASSADSPGRQPQPVGEVTKYIVAGGACVNDDQRYVCALEKTQCADGWKYLSARQLEDLDKDTPVKQCIDDANIVPVGQCTQDKDKEICTGHMSSCEGCLDTDDVCFRANVDSCYFQPTDQGDGTINFASFGLCVNPAYPDRKHCLWSRDECPQDDVWVTPNTWIGDTATVDDFCTCDRVQVGACYTDDNFVCAVSADSCDPQQNYIGAKDLTEQYPNIDCRLCNDFGIAKDVTLSVTPPKEDEAQSNPDPKPDATQPIAQLQVTSYIVAGGACVNSDGQYVCALEKTQCQETWNFLSARQLEELDQDSPVKECIGDANIVPVGRCTQDRDRDICTGHQSTCEGCFETNEICFQANVESCSLQPKEQGDGSINFGSFGLCVNPAFPDRRHCLWSRNECPQDSVWVTPNTWLNDSASVDEFCTCDKVNVGACFTDDSFVCAVSSDSCDDGQKYIGPKDMSEQYPTIDCRLCNEFELSKDLTLNFKPSSTEQTNTQPNAQPNAQQSNQVAPQVTEYVVASGACVQNERYVCALEKTQCSDGFDFISAMLLQEKYRESPAIQCLNEADIVPVGQCLQDRDKGICTGHMSNCEGCLETSDACFQMNVESCSIQPQNNADGSINFATFGLCINPAYPDRKHCLWSRNECPQDNVWVTPNAWLTDTTTVDEFCTCDKVQLGACRKGDSFMCAVSGDACDADEEYVGAKTLTELDYPIDCRLCKDFAIPKDTILSVKYPQPAPVAPPKPVSTPAAVAITPSPSQGMVATYGVVAGACINQFEYWCALEATQCAEGYEFVSARMLQQNYRQTPAINCLDQAKNVPVGQCTRGSDNGICTGHMSNCQGCYETSGVCFEPNNAVCKIEATQNQDGSINHVGYGLCVNTLSPNDPKCLWSANECATTSTWLTPSRRLQASFENDQCTCDKVLIGACRSGTNLICAVSPDACDKDSVYVSSKELRDIAPSIDCRLCTSLDPPIPLPGQKTEESESSGPDDGAIATTVIFVVALLSMMGVVLWSIERKRSRAVRSADQEGMIINPDGGSINSSASSVSSMVTTPTITVTSDGTLNGDTKNLSPAEIN